jgi:hemolysin activation/secretion protein
VTFGPFIVRRGVFPTVLATATLATLAPVALAQPVPYNIGDAVRQTEESRRAPLPRPAAVPVLPQLTEPQLKLGDKQTLLVRSFQIEGPNLVGEAEARAALEPYEGRRLTIGEIYSAADKISTLYREHGYLVAKAYVPVQNVRRGTLTIKVVAGSYGMVTVKNESLVRDDYVQGLVDKALGRSSYIHKDSLERAILLISDLPGAGVPRAAIGAGRRPETSDFVFAVPQGQRIDGYVLGDNYGSPFTGRNRLSGGINLNSPLGYGDRLSGYGIVSDTGDLLNGRAAYSVPLGYDGLRAEIAGFRTTYVLGGAYKDLDATGTANGVTGTLTYALKRSREDNIFLSVNYTYKALNDNLLGVSFADRTIDSATAAITRETLGLFAGLPVATSTTASITGGRLRFSDATQEAQNIAGANTVGEFAKVNLQFTTTVGLTDKLSFAGTFRAQRSLTGNLDSSEQMSLTGYWGVRSFDEGLSGDSGFLLTPEVKYALPDIANYKHAIGVFGDVGGVWIEDASYTTTQQSYTHLGDIGFGYYATYEYAPSQVVLLKAQVAHTVGSSDGAQTYNRGTTGLVQAGFTF